jgi:hypothetical protein
MVMPDSDLADLQQLLDDSFARSSEHLRSIMTPERRLSAAALVEALPCPAVLNIATVTAGGLPRISAVDGHFMHDAWHFTTDATSPKARQLIARPAISASYTPRDGFGVFCHGSAIALAGDERAELREHFREVYGADPEDWGTIAYFRIEARWMTGFAMTDEEMVAIEADRAARQQGKGG